MRATTKLFTLIALWVLATPACTESDPLGDPPDAAVGSLDEVDLPADFTFRTTRPVSVRLTIPEARRLPGHAPRVEIRLSDGGVVFRGNAGKDGSVLLTLPLPRATRALEVTLTHVVDEPQVVAVPVSSTGGVDQTL